MEKKQLAELSPDILEKYAPLQNRCLHATEHNVIMECRPSASASSPSISAGSDEDDDGYVTLEEIHEAPCHTVATEGQESLTGGLEDFGSNSKITDENILEMAKRLTDAKHLDKTTEGTFWLLNLEISLIIFVVFLLIFY